MVLLEMRGFHVPMRVVLPMLVYICRANDNSNHLEDLDYYKELFLGALAVALKVYSVPYQMSTNVPNLFLTGYRSLGRVLHKGVLDGDDLFALTTRSGNGGEKSY
jgi:hypothetical protein